MNSNYRMSDGQISDIVDMCEEIALKVMEEKRSRLRAAEIRTDLRAIWISNSEDDLETAGRLLNELRALQA